MRAVYLAMTAVLGFGSGLIMPAYVVYYVRTARLGPLELVLVATVLEASYFVFNIPTGAFADTYGRRWAIVLGVAVIGGGWLIQGLIPIFGFILLAEGVRGVGEAFMDGATDAWIAGSRKRRNASPTLAVPVLGPLLAAAEVCRILAILVFALASGFPLAIAARFGKSAVESVTRPLYQAWLTANIEPRARATVLSMHSLCNAGGQIAGGPVIGAVGSLLSICAALVAGTAFVLPNVLLYLRAGGEARAAAAAIP